MQTFLPCSIRPWPCSYKSIGHIFGVPASAWIYCCGFIQPSRVLAKPGQILHCYVRLTYDHFWVDVDWKSECFPKYLGHGFGGCLLCIQMRATGLPLSRAEKQQPVCRVTGLVTISILFSWFFTIKVLCKKGGSYISTKSRFVCQLLLTVSRDL